MSNFFHPYFIVTLVSIKFKLAVVHVICTWITIFSCKLQRPLTVFNMNSKCCYENVVLTAIKINENERSLDAVYFVYVHSK